MRSGDVVWNPLTGEKAMLVEPALRFEEAILAFWGMCADGHTNREGRPTPLRSGAS